MASALDPFPAAVAGSLASVASNAIVYPVDLLTTRMQTAGKGKLARRQYGSLLKAFNTILSNQGVGAFYRGIISDSLSTMLSSFLYFLAYSSIRDAFIARRAPAASASSKGKAKAPLLSAVEELLIGCLAGIIAKGAVSPLSNITIRQQTAAGSSKGKEKAEGDVQTSDSDSEEEDVQEPSMADIARDILAEKGWTGFWSGFKSSIILSINPAITMYTFEALKRTFIPARHREHPPPIVTFFAGALASSTASLITYPLILAKARLQYKSPSGRRMYSSNLDVFRQTLQRSGPAGLYKGVEGQVLKGFASEGVKLLLKERIELLIVLVDRLLVRRELKAQA